jgi:hypothetical protein
VTRPFSVLGQIKEATTMNKIITITKSHLDAIYLHSLIFQIQAERYRGMGESGRDYAMAADAISNALLCILKNCKSGYSDPLYGLCPIEIDLLHILYNQIAQNSKTNPCPSLNTFKDALEIVLNIKPQNQTVILSTLSLN